MMSGSFKVAQKREVVVRVYRKEGKGKLSLGVGLNQLPICRRQQNSRWQQGKDDCHDTSSGELCVG